MGRSQDSAADRTALFSSMRSVEPLGSEIVLIGFMCCCWLVWGLGQVFWWPAGEIVIMVLNHDVDSGAGTPRLYGV